ncbi:Hypothetical protein D9617_90g064640 [Elsinoe fawcettii]|nr:Hypothetical protein D9617_90g064640 [Elsinoe fawcettii]
MSEDDKRSTGSGLPPPGQVCPSTVPAKTEEHERLVRVKERIKHLQDAIQVLTEEIQEREAGQGEESDGFGWIPKYSKKRRKARQPWSARLREITPELEQFMEVLRRKEANAEWRREQREAIQQCEQRIADLTVAAEKATAEVSRQQLKLEGLWRELDGHDKGWHSKEEGGFAVVEVESDL